MKTERQAPVDRPRKLTVLYIDNTSTFGGAINSLRNVLQAIDRDRFAPVLVSGQPGEMLSRRFDVTCHRLVPKRSWVDNRRYLKIRELPIFRFRYALKVLNFLRHLYWLMFIHIPEGFRYFAIGRKHRASIVHLNNIIGSQLSGIIAAKLLRVPCIAHLRDFEAVDPITRFYASMVDHHVAISNAIRNNLEALGVPGNRITVIPDSVDAEALPTVDSRGRLLEEFGIGPGHLTFGLFGRVIGWKGTREFILAAKKVTTDLPEARAFVVGGPSDGDRRFFLDMRVLAVELGLNGRVFFTGYRDDVTTLMAGMDVVVHASNRPEPFGMVIIEAMAQKKPVVATRGGGPLDIVVDNETGLLVDMGDVDALSNAIEWLLRHPEAREKMGNAGYRRAVSRFSIQQAARELEEIYLRMGASG